MYYETVSCIAFGILVAGGEIFAQQNNIAEIFSPDKKISCYVQYIDGNLAGILNLNSINTEVVKLDIGLKTNSETLGTKNDVLISKTSNEYDGVILSGLSEKKEIIDRYNETVLCFSSPKGVSFKVYLRLYNEGIAVKYFVKSNTAVGISSDKTGIDLTAFSSKCYSESATESGYSERGSRANGNSLAPLFITTEKFSVLMNEAANLALADPAKIKFSNSRYTFLQSYDFSSEISTSWRYIIFAANPVKMIDGKYIITSLNEKNSDDISWI
ncbi:MAG: glycoside hydrolase family 97 N-terminal domain-containing protein, partial [Bacteroidales bacterium]|nr:glycoside hydrolase family 97 N-terminal domain-containing protein [Bacteroidales bacterium]